MEGPFLSTYGDSSSDGHHMVNISDDEETPYDQIVHPFDSDAYLWGLVEFLATLLQILVAISVLTLKHDEQQRLQKILVTMIISYTCGCFATLPILSWRLWWYNQCTVSSTIRLNKVMNNLRIMVGYFFVGWITVLVYVLIHNSSSQDYTKPQTWVCLAFLAYSCVQHVFRNFRCSFVCLMLPMFPYIAGVYYYIDDIDEKLTYLGIALFALVVIFNCICK